MKNFLRQFAKLGFLVLVVVLLMVGAVSYSLKNKKADNAYAVGSGEAGSIDITGEAWSENIGWIRFNGVATNGSPYGVGMKEINGIGRLSGHAWADKDHIGWISFNRSETGNPPASASYDPGLSQTGQPMAYIDTDGKTVKGWARATAACDNNGDGDCVDAGEGSGPGTNSGGWDGWIALGDTKPSVNPAYGVTLNTATKQFEGFAWGSDVVGWASFNKLNCDSDNNGKVDVACGSDNSSISIGDYKVATNFELNLTPNAPTAMGMSSPNYCSLGSITFGWTFNDPNTSSGNKQAKYKIEASFNNFTNIIYTTGEVDTSGDTSGYTVDGTGTHKNFTKTISLSDLGNWYNKTLYWRITVWDDGVTQKSATATAPTYNLPDHGYNISFNSNPIFAEIHADQDVEFSDKSTCYNSSSPSGTPLNTDTPVCGSRLWNFSSNAVPTTSTLANPIVKFSKSASTTVSLTYTDTDRYSNTYTCSSSQNIAIKLPIPKFEEKK